MHVSYHATGGVMYHEPLELRFWSKVKKQKNGCWVWTGSKNAAGYGSIRIDNVGTKRVHILSYEWYHGELLPGLEVDHSCRNRACVNPRHLQPVSHAENMRLVWERNPHERPTHCRHGHELTAETMAVGADRWRCRICARERTARGRARQAGAPRPLPPRPEVCANGHPMDEANAYAARGSWHCRQCQKDASERYRAKYQETPRELPLPPAVCANGHAMEGDNLQRSKTQWFCKMCRNEQQRRSYHKRQQAQGLTTSHRGPYNMKKE